MLADPKKQDASQAHVARNTWLLLCMLLLAATYTGWFAYFGTLSGSNRLDGTLGILLGLYICSHPAANMLEILLFMKPYARESLVSTGAGRLWLFLNLLTVLAAWAVIFNAVLRFVTRTPAAGF
jgi:hypothetical protein